MIWRVAHLLFKETKDTGEILITEEIWLLKANNDTEAWSIAKGKLAEYAATVNQKIFVGCRKIMKMTHYDVRDEDDEPDDGTELSFQHMEVDTLKEVDDLVHCVPVKLNWID